MGILENSTFITALASFCGVVVVGWLGLKGNMHKTLSGSMDANRVQLDTAQAKLMDDLFKSVDAYQLDIEKLKIEVESVRTINNELQLQTIDLMSKIKTLTDALDKYTACNL